MRLGRLTRIEISKVQSEEAELEASVQGLRDVLISDDRVLDILVKDSNAISQKYSVPRRTKILRNELSITQSDLVVDEQCIISLSADGYVKRQSLNDYNRVGNPEAMEIRAYSVTFLCNTLDSVVFLTKK